MKILVTIASWGTKNDRYLARLIQEYGSMSFGVDVVVLSNLQKPVELGAQLCVVDLKGKNPWSFPFVHKKIFAERANDYDLFIYSEDDTLITESNIRAFLKACVVLERNEIAGFLRYERGTAGRINYPEMHGPFHWACQSVRRRGEQVFASFTNEHSACYVLTRDQLQRAIASGGFLVEPHSGKYDLICSAATDPYTQCGFEKVIGISPLDDFLVHHLPNTYLGSACDVGASELCSQIECLIAILKNGQHPKPLFPVETKLMHDRFSKDCYEKVQREIVAMVPDGTQSLLSVGCGWGATEASLVGQGMRVVALPAEPVFACSVKRKGLEVVEGNLATVRETLEGEQFDCILLLDTLHLMQDPGMSVSSLAKLLRVGATMIARIPRVLRFTTAYRVIRGDQHFRELGGYETTGVHFTSQRTVQRWFKNAGLRVESVRIEMPSPAAKGSGSWPRLLNPIRAMKMDAKMVVTARKI